MELDTDNNQNICLTDYFLVSLSYGVYDIDGQGQEEIEEEIEEIGITKPPRYEYDGQPCEMECQVIL